MKISGAKAKPLALRTVLESVRDALSAAGIADSRLEAEVLARFALGWERDRFLAELYAGEETRLSPGMSERLRSLANRRIGGEPLAYITGTREFYGLPLHVDERVLIPRQETELLVEIALEKLGAMGAASSGRRPLAIDVGTGSGAVALALAANARHVRIIAADVSGEALALARRNAESLGLAREVEFVHCDLLAAISARADLIISNPPYIPSGDMAGLQAEIRREPRLALDGGADGLAVFRRLARQAARTLAPGGALIVELSPDQMDAAERVAAERISQARRISRRRDLFGDDRALVVETA